MTVTDASSYDTGDAPVTTADLLEALEKWQTALGPAERDRKAVRLRKAGESVTVLADLAALHRRQAGIELAEGCLSLRWRSTHWTIPLWCFDFKTRARGPELEILFTVRRQQLVRECVRRVSESANRELWPAFFRVLDVAETAPLQGALLARLVKALADVTENVEDRVAAEAVSESSDPLTLVRLLERPDMLERLRESDPLAPARLRGISARQRLLEMAGGALSVEEAAAALGLTRQAVDKRRRAGKLLAISLGKRGFRFPAFQFVRGGVLPGLEKVLGGLREHDPWMQLSFFVNRHSDLDDQSPVAVLHAADEEHVEAVITAAATLGEHGAA
jgi:hypothetical protein